LFISFLLLREGKVNIIFRNKQASVEKVGFKFLKDPKQILKTLLFR
jgi:hypothetical protein